MPQLADVTNYLDTTLDITRFRDYCPNGLQVQGKGRIEKIVTGVSASLELFQKAHAQKADAVVVHHGLIWGNGLERISGVMAERLRFLLTHEMSLLAYHLPLDVHPRLGNNVGIADVLELVGPRSWFGQLRGHAIGLAGSWGEPVAADLAFERIAKAFAPHGARFVFAHGPAQVRKIGICSGAAADFLEAAKDAGCDLFITGELAERAEEVAKERGIHLVAVGHYASEVFGPKALATELQNRLSIDATFIDTPVSL